MQHYELQSPTELTDTINSFWYLSRDFGEMESTFEVMPDGYAEIIFHFGSSCSILLDGHLQLLPSPFLTGLLNKPVIFHAAGTLQIIGIRCYPWTVFALLGLPPNKGGVRTFEHPIAELQVRLSNLLKGGDVTAALKFACDYFVKSRMQIASNETLNKAGAALTKANGALQVSEVAASAHATVRTLERQFKKSSGHTVKDVAGLMRFEQVRDRIWCDQDVNLAALAQELGYSDQSHLGREFKRYSGVTPLAFARKARQSRESLANDFVAFVLSR